jgi:hypothetical protein
MDRALRPATLLLRIFQDVLFMGFTAEKLAVTVVPSHSNETIF